MKILIDMNLSLRWEAVLSGAGFVAVHWANLGAAQAPDEEIMSYARAGDWIVLTQDLDFSAILAVTHGEKPSVIQIRSAEVSPEAIGSLVVAAIQQMRSELELGALVTVDPERTRVRFLPLRARGQA
jgi:predicted nuclease of predicted toxin-antitoxin system